MPSDKKYNIVVDFGSIRHMSKLPELPFANEENNLDFAGPLDAFWGASDLY